MSLIKTVVIPAAGLGSRLFPLTFSTPKELMPIFNKPALFYILKEIYDSKIENIVLIISNKKNIIRELLEYVKINDKNSFISKLNFRFLYQNENYGLEHCLYLIKNEIKEDFFGLVLPDEIFFYNEINDNPFVKTINFFNKKQKSIILTKQIDFSETNKYGIISFQDDRISKIVEKPNNSESNIAIVGRYIFSAKIFNYLNINSYSLKKETCLSNILNVLIKNNEIENLNVDNTRFDIGNFNGLNTANIFFGILNHEKK